MSQNDFTIANQSFPAFRADLNSALQALASNNSGTSAPSTTFANMWWYDSANNILYIRNEDNDAWIQFATLDQTNDLFVVTSSIDVGDNVKALFGDSDDLQIFHNGSNSFVKDVGSGALILDTNGTDVRITKSDAEFMAKFVTDGAVELYYDQGTYATYKLATTSTGIDVTGTATMDGLTVDGDAIIQKATGDVSLTIQANENGSNREPSLNLKGYNTSSNPFIAFGDNLGYNGIIEYENQNDNMIFYSNGGETFRLDGSGNVGIGNSSPTGKLDISGGNTYQPHLRITNSAGGGRTFGLNVGVAALSNGYFAIKDETADAYRMVISDSGNVGIGTSSPQRTLHLNESTSDSIYLHITNSTTGTTSTDGLIVGLGASEDAYIWQYENKALIFATNNTESMRISSGKLLINTTSTLGVGQGVLHLKGASDNTVCVVQVASNGERGLDFRNTSGTEVGSVQVGASSTAYITSSDYRLKESVTYDFDATTRLKQLKPARFNFIADADTTVDGFLAHEVQSVVPEAISGTYNEVDADGNPKYQGIDQSKLVPLLVKTIQELEARITALETA